MPSPAPHDTYRRAIAGSSCALRTATSRWPLRSFRPSAPAFTTGSCASRTRILSWSACVDRSWRLSAHHQQVALIFGGCDQDPAIFDQPVHLAPHTEGVRDVHAGLDRKADAGDERALFTCLEVVDVGSRSVYLVRIDRVAGAMREVL